MTPQVAVVIPAYHAEKTIAEVVRSIPSLVRWIVVVNDGGPNLNVALAPVAEERLELITMSGTGGSGRRS